MSPDTFLILRDHLQLCDAWLERPGASEIVWPDIQRNDSGPSVGGDQFSRSCPWTRSPIAGMLAQEASRGAWVTVDTEAIRLGAIFFAIAALYASGGQAGASGYISALSLFGFTPLAMKTTALALNLIVVGIGTVTFLNAGRLSWASVYPFAILGFPFSLLGGSVHLPDRVYNPFVGVVLILSALQMVRTPKITEGQTRQLLNSCGKAV